MNRTNIVLGITLSLIGLSGWFLWPSVKWYRMPVDEREQLEKENDPMLRKILNLGLDLKGGTHLLLELEREKLPTNVKTQDALDRAIEIIRNRVDQFGVAEPLIARQGERWIVIQLPGLKDPQRAKELIGKTALLEFRLQHEGEALAPISRALLDKKMSFDDYFRLKKEGTAPADVTKLIPAGYELVPQRREGESLSGRYMLLKSSPELTGATLVDARVSFGGNNENSLGRGYPSVSIEFNPEGTQLFGMVTQANVGKQLAIVLDGVVQSAPQIRTAIPDGHAIIEGNFSSEEARDLANILKAGALPAPVRVIEERTVGPTLGEDSINAGMRSCLIGMAMILLFMFVYYRTSGLIADVAVLINMLFIFGILASLHATLTLPGVAGTILSVAMAVDANVLILERVREELQLGKSVRLAVDLGYEHAWAAILDGHVTTLITAALLFQFGTGPVKGFAVTLFWGVAISLFTAVFFTRMMYDLWFSRSDVKTLKF